MSTTLVKELRFEAAHQLPKTPPGHKCRRLHGHSFVCEIHIRGEVDEETGWVLDFADVDTAFAPLMEILDHNFLNDVPGLENPTSENLAQYIWKAIDATLPGLCAIVVHETCTSRCIYTGDP